MTLDMNNSKFTIFKMDHSESTPWNVLVPVRLVRESKRVTDKEVWPWLNPTPRFFVYISRELVRFKTYEEACMFVRAVMDIECLLAKRYQSPPNLPNPFESRNPFKPLPSYGRPHGLGRRW